MPYFQTLPDFERNEKLLKLLMLFLKILYYRGYLGKIWRNSKFHDWRPILHSSRHRLLTFLLLELPPATQLLLLLPLLLSLILIVLSLTTQQQLLLTLLPSVESKVWMLYECWWLSRGDSRQIKHQTDRTAAPYSYLSKQIHNLYQYEW